MYAKLYAVHYHDFHLKCGTLDAAAKFAFKAAELNFLQPISANNADLIEDVRLSSEHSSYLVIAVVSKNGEGTPFFTLESCDLIGFFRGKPTQDFKTVDSDCWVFTFYKWRPPMYQ